MSKPVNVLDVPADSDNHLPASLTTKVGNSEWRSLGSQFGLTHFGVNLETLAPGAQSSLKHWHTESDEFVYLVYGELMLATSTGEWLLKPGMCVGFKAGVENAHHLVNRSDTPATFLVIGSNNGNDKVFYPEDDLQWLKVENGIRKAARKDGTFYD